MSTGPVSVPGRSVNSHKVVAEHLRRMGWHLVQYVGLGTAADVFVVDVEGERCALKVQRGESQALAGSTQRSPYLSGSTSSPYAWAKANRSNS